MNFVGQITHILLIKDKHQGFIEFKDKDQATAALHYFLQHPLNVRYICWICISLLAV